jgi:PhnB protein
MNAKVNVLPEGFQTITPYIIYQDAAAAIEFYKRAFGATELFRMAGMDGKIGHAEIMIGTSPLMLVDENPDFPDLRSPQSLGGSPVHLHLYVEDVDGLMDRVVAAGATLLMPPKDSPDGERRGGVSDPFGLTWWIATRKREVSRTEMQQEYDTQSR